MRKYLFIILLMFMAGVGAKAQIGWTKTIIKADELKGNTDYPCYQFENKAVGAFLHWDWNDHTFRLVTYKGMFHELIYNTGFGPFRAVKLLVGIYNNDDGSLDEKFVLYVNIQRNCSNQRIELSPDCLPKSKKKGKKIKDALKSGTKRVRFVCERYNDSDFDIEVPPYVGSY